MFSTLEFWFDQKSQFFKKDQSFHELKSFSNQNFSLEVELYNCKRENKKFGPSFSFSTIEKRVFFHVLYSSKYDIFCVILFSNYDTKIIFNIFNNFYLKSVNSSMKFFDVNQRFAQIWLSKILSLKMSFSGVNKSSTNFFISVKSLQKKNWFHKKKCENFFCHG